MNVHDLCHRSHPKCQFEHPSCLAPEPPPSGSMPMSQWGWMQGGSTPKNTEVFPMTLSHVMLSKENAYCTLTVSHTLPAAFRGMHVD
jgi:hypothetical protein